MNIISLEKINELNNDLKNKLPIIDYKSHLFASSINLLISGNYFEGYKTYKEYSRITDCIDKRLELKIINFASCKLILEKRFSEAKFVLEEAIEEYSRNVPLNNNLAVVHFKLNEPQLALERLENALKLDPNNKELNRNYRKLAK